jgi:hypothetical protein
VPSALLRNRNVVTAVALAWLELLRMISQLVVADTPAREKHMEGLAIEQRCTPN